MQQIQQWEDNVLKQSEIRKTRKGWVGRKIKQIYLRDDVSCGFKLCKEHRGCSAFQIQPQKAQKFYFIDSETLINHTDIIYNCQQIRNLIVLQSSIQKLKNYNPSALAAKKQQKNKNNVSKYNAFRTFVESVQAAADRSIFVLADNYHRGISEVNNNEKESEKQEFYLLRRCIQWYQRHAVEIGLKSITFTLLTSNQKIIERQSVSDIKIQKIVQLLMKQNSNLLDFVALTEESGFFKETVFSQFKEQIQIYQGVKMGKYFQGKYMKQKSYFKLLNRTVSIELRNNRAMFGDVVAIQLDPREMWKNRKIKKANLQEQKYAEAQLTQTFNSEINPQKEKQIQNLIHFIEEQPNIQPTGKVIAVTKRLDRLYCGTLQATAPIYKSVDHMHDQNEPEYEIYEFIPADGKFQKFYVRTFNIQQLRNKRIVVSFDKWPATSRYPLAHYVRSIGIVGDSTAEADTILLQHNVEIKQFSKAAYACLPPSGQKFIIPQKELEYREDLRHLDVCSIDPPGCKDIDDALHCIELENGNLQIGVHIADVSYYVRPDSALDLEARNRCTTVYLVDRRTDMLPKLLTQNLCSLRANVDRLSFSTIWQMDRKANIIKTRYCKTIIRSRRAFTYMQAQQLMDSNDKGPLARSIRNLNHIAKQLKQRRNEQGALTLASTQVKITLQEETHNATDVRMYQMVQTNYLIEEFMLLSNITVAEKIYEKFPALSILRRHTQPKVAQLEILKEILKGLGHQLRWQTSKELAHSLDLITRENDQFFNNLVRIMTTRCMNQATYFCSADHDQREFYHYGLAAPFYTHFTSPIRRYADVLVHRLLAAAIDLQPLPTFMINKIKMTKICDQMNMRNRMARYASRASSDYHTYQFFKDRNEPEKAIITQIDADNATLMLIKYGLQTKVLLSAADSLSTQKLNQGSGIYLKLQLNGKKYSLFDYLLVLVKVELKGFHKEMKIQVM